MDAPIAIILAPGRGKRVVRDRAHAPMSPKRQRVHGKAGEGSERAPRCGRWRFGVIGLASQRRGRTVYQNPWARPVGETGAFQIYTNC